MSKTCPAMYLCMAASHKSPRNHFTTVTIVLNMYWRYANDLCKELVTCLSSIT